MSTHTLPQTIVRLLRSEALAVGIITITIYWQLGFAWLPLVLLVLLPDLFMIGYAKNSRLGAQLYNIGHTYLMPFGLFAAWFFFGHVTALLMAGLIWALHIAFDRTMGYGLKFDTGFTHTHLGEIGPKKDQS